MARFRDPPDPLFQRLNASIGFDRRLAPYDVEQSRAHARALHAAGVLDDEELARIEEGLEHRRGRARGRLLLRSWPAMRTSTWRSSGGSQRSSGRSAASSTPAARATTRWRPTSPSTCATTRAQAERLAGSLMGRLLELAERHADWPMPGYTHLQRAQPVYLGHHLLAYFWMLRRDARRFAAGPRSRR